MLRFLKYSYKIFIDAVFPSRCLICGMFFNSPDPGYIFQVDKANSMTTSFQSVMEPFLCPDCLKNYMEVHSPRCTVCGFMFQSREGSDHVCGECIKSPPAFGKARAYGLYEGALRSSIHHLKYHHREYLGEPLGLLLFYTFIRNWNPDNIDVIIPIPLHKGRLRNRGFNQTYQLIRKWPRWWKKINPDSSSLNVDQDIMGRKKRTKAQVGMGRKERIKNIKGVFEVVNPLKIKGKKVLLIDDVLTTGATANECVKTLMKKGARHVDLLTLAHTERHI